MTQSFYTDVATELCRVDDLGCSAQTFFRLNVDRCCAKTALQKKDCSKDCSKDPHIQGSQEGFRNREFTLSSFFDSDLEHLRVGTSIPSAKACSSLSVSECCCMRLRESMLLPLLLLLHVFRMLLI